MGIGSNHPDYDARLPLWRKIRDVAEGEEAVKAKSGTYLPPLPGHKGENDEGYQHYLAGAYLFEGTSRTAEAFAGMLTRKDPAVELPATAESWRAVAGGPGRSLDELLVATVGDMVYTGRCGVLVDWPGSTAGLTRAEAERAGSAPRLRVYPAESIVNWLESDNGVLLWVMLEESARPDGADRYSHDTIRQRRELFLDASEDGQTAIYRQRVYQLVENKETREEKWVQVGGDTTPLRNNSTIDSIPWQWFGAQENGSEPSAPPLRQIVNANLAMYRNSAAFEKALIYGGNPQPWISLGGFRGVGAGEDGETPREYVIGGTEVWELPEGSEAGVLNFATGAEMPLERAITAKKADMAVLGARMLEGQKKGAEAAETEEIRRSGENSALGRIADNLTLGWTRVLEIVAEWAGWGGELGLTFSKDFLTRAVTAQEVTTAMDLYLRGVWAMEDLHSYLISGEWQPETRTSEAVQADIEQARPAALPVGNGGAQ